MRKLFLRVLLLTIPFGISACGLFDDQSTPYGYVKSSFRIIDEHALYANGDWIIERESYLSEAKSIDNYDDAHRIVKSALAFAGGKHSALVAPVTDTTEYEELPSEAYMLEGGIAYVKLPAHSGVKVSDSIYIHTVLDFLQSHLDAAGVILDLRDNLGGNMYPMITAVAPLLPDGDIISFQTRKRTFSTTLDFAVQDAGLSLKGISKLPDNTLLPFLPMTGPGVRESSRFCVFAVWKKPEPSAYQLLGMRVAICLFLWPMAIL